MQKHLSEKTINTKDNFDQSPMALFPVVVYLSDRDENQKLIMCFVAVSSFTVSYV